MPTVADPAAINPSAVFRFGKAADAVAYLNDRGFRTDVWNWFDMASDAHARSFTVAKAARLDVLQAIRDALLASGSEGDFIKSLTPELQRLGWWGKQIVVGSEGAAEVTQLGSPARLRTIYRSNMAAAYSAARFRQQLADARSRPFWQYVAVLDLKTRPGHAAMNGRIFRFDDPIWRSHYPPCDYNCRCRVTTYTAKEIERRGLKVESSEGQLTTETVEVGVNKRTGEVIQQQTVRWSGKDALGNPVSMAPNPAWSTNPGLVPWQPNLDRYDADLARHYVSETLQGPAFERTWQRVENAAAKLVRDNPRATPSRLRESLRGAVHGERYPVAVLDAKARELMGVRTQTVLVSDDTLAKQALSRTGQDMTLADYWKVQATIESADVIVREGELVLVFVKSGDSWLLAVVKRTQEGRELYLTSFRRSNARDLARTMRSGEVLRDAR